MPFCELDLISGQLVEWKIDPNILGGPGDTKKTIFLSLFDQYEYAGRFTMHYEIQKECTFDTCELKPVQKSKIDKFNKGSATSVKTSDGYCNFHTHPFSCYKGEQTMWGWPSGEDMRECIGFMLRNNLFHLVFTLEGIYLIQVNPNFLSILLDDEKLGKLIEKPINDKESKNKNEFLHADRVRGLIISLIESYFKATHGHRGIEYNLKNRKEININEKNKYNSRHWGVCMPDDWVDFSNKFKLSNMNNLTHNQCSKHLPCNCFPDYETKIGTIPLSQYLKDYGIDIYDMSSSGKICDVSIVQKGGKEQFEDTYYQIIQQNFTKIIDLFEGPSVSNNLRYGNETWNKGQWFNVQLFYNEFQCNSTIPEYTDFLGWMQTCIIKEKQTNITLPHLVHEFWATCNKKKAGFRFSSEFPAKVFFKALKPPNGKKSCDIRHGDDIHKWIHHHTGTHFSTIKKNKTKNKKTKRKQTKKQKKSFFGGALTMSEYKGRKKISSFGLNPNKR